MCEIIIFVDYMWYECDLFLNIDIYAHVFKRSFEMKTTSFIV